MNEEYEAELCHLMATDELSIYEELSIAEEFEAFYEAFDERRRLLNELDRHRILTLAYNPEEIQAVFTRLSLPLVIKEPLND